jgi:hypothetical protein
MGAPWPQHLQLLHHDWRKAQEWLSRVARHILPTKDESSIFVPASETVCSHMSKEEFKDSCRKYNQKVQPLQAECFDAYVKRRGAFYKLKPIVCNHQQSDFVVYSCICPHYQRKAFCKHCIGVGIWKQKFAIPAEMSIAALGGKGKRGRKKRLANTCYGADAKVPAHKKHKKTRNERM